jgi:hypothetical protein
MLVFLGIVAAIAERFVRGFAAATESRTVAYAIGLSVGRLHLDAATNPERATDAYLGVFYGDEGLLQNWLDVLPRFLVVNDESARRAIAGLFDNDLLDFRVLAILDEIPDAAGTMAKACGRAEFLVVG